MTFPPSRRQKFGDPPHGRSHAGPSGTNSHGTNSRPGAHSGPKNARGAPAPPTHGNFVGYYTKRPRGDGGDPRLALVPSEWIEGKRVLDVGCNSGQVTVELAQAYRAGEVVGVDIDEELIRLAKRHIGLAWSRQSPLPELIEAAKEATAPRSRDAPPHQRPSSSLLRAPPAPPSSVDHFPIGLARMYGYTPQPHSELLLSPSGQTVFPGNIKFATADWAARGLSGEDGERYDAVFALSITKWIHLNTLNAGLLTFFKRLYDVLLPGGKLILEPQPFASYAKSARLSDELKANLRKLKGTDNEDGEEKAEEGERGWREEEGDFERVLLEVGFERRERLGETGEKGFRRPVDVYFKRET